MPRKSTLNPAQSFVVTALVVALLALGCALVRLVSDTDRLGTLSSDPPTPVPSLSPDPTAASTTVPSEPATSREPVPMTSQGPESALAATKLLPVPTWQPPTVPSDAELEAMVARMSLQDKVAQMVMVGFRDQSLASSPELETMVGTYHVGGVVLLATNAHDPQQIGDLTTELQSLATSSGAGIPLFVAINHEGGIVVHITGGVTEFPGNMAVAATGQPEYAYVSAALAAQELRAMGINMNLAPVLDVNDNLLNPAIGTRSFSDSPALTAKYGRLAVRGSQDHGVIAVAKHFPGHGSVDVDSHKELPVLQASADELMQRELVSFLAAIEEGVAGIMTAHIAVPQLDDSGRPATLSPQVLTELLRQQMGYDGLILTDSLRMGGVAADREQAQAAIEAVQAGADIVLSTRPMKAHIAMIQALMEAVQQGEIPVKRIDQSVLRILRAKHAFGLFELPTTPDLNGVGSPEHQAMADEIALRAVTLLRDNNDRVPLPPPPARLLLVSPSQLPSAASGGGTAFAELLRERGYEVTELVLDMNSNNRRNYVHATAVARASTHDAVIFGEWALIKRYVNENDRWQEKLIGALDQTGTALTVVAWYNPAAILRCPPAPAFLTAYGNTRAQVAAVVAVLTGEHTPTGRIPIALPEVVPNK
jgi:beta-N-acetylhexosaminidase